MAVLTVQTVVRSGVGPTYASCAGGGDKFLPDATTFLHVKNGSGGDLTVTVAAVATVLPNLSVGNVAVSVPAGAERMIGPFPAQFFANSADGNADITYSGVTSLTIAAVKVSQP